FCDHFFDSLFIQTAPAAFWFAWGKALHETLIIQRPYGTVDPAKTKSFFHCIVVNQLWLTRRFFIIYEPNALRLCVIFLQPFSPGIACFWMEAFKLLM